jgi:hypothetical protein
MLIGVAGAAQHDQVFIELAAAPAIGQVVNVQVIA